MQRRIAMNDKFNYSKNTAVIFMVTCAVLWSTAGILIKFLPWNPLVIAGARSLISAGIYILYMRWEGIRFVINRFSVFSGIALAGTFLFFIAANNPNRKKMIHGKKLHSIFCNWKKMELFSGLASSPVIRPKL